MGTRPYQIDHFALFISTEKYTSSSLQKYTILINKGAVLL